MHKNREYIHVKSQVSMLMVNGKAFGSELRSGTKREMKSTKGEGPILLTDLNVHRGAPAPSLALATEESSGL